MAPTAQEQHPPQAASPPTLPSRYAVQADGRLAFPEKPVVLYVDDEEQNLVSFRIAFKRDFTVLVAQQARQALAILHEHAVELIVTDQRMPDMTGVELLEQVVAHHPATMRMIITGYSDIGVVVDAINAGHVYRYLSKPWVHQELLQAMQSAVRFFRLNQERSHLLQHLESLVAERTAELESKNESLTQTLEALRATQQQLVATEKRAALGSLVSNIAHEINSPGSAVLSIARYTGKKLPRLIEKLLGILNRLDAPAQELFQQLVTEALVARPGLSTRAERKARHDMVQQLEEAGVLAGQREAIAARLVQLNPTSSLQRIQPLVVRPDAEEVLLAAEEFVSLAHQTHSIAEAAERILRLVRLLKNYKDIADETTRTPTDILSTLERALGQLGHLLTKTIHVEWQLPNQLPPVHANADQLQLVWFSLLHNALLALLAVGGGRLTVGAQHDAEGVSVRIHDTGEGMKPDVLARAFEPFYTTRPGGQGSGLGLDISRRIVEAHRGTLTASSSAGDTCFTVHLPLVTPT